MPELTRMKITASGTKCGNRQIIQEKLIIITTEIK